MWTVIGGLQNHVLKPQIVIFLFVASRESVFTISNTYKEAASREGPFQKHVVSWILFRSLEVSRYATFLFIFLTSRRIIKWSTPHGYDLCRALMSFATPTSYAASDWATPHPDDLCSTRLSYAAPVSETFFECRSRFFLGHDSFHRVKQDFFYFRSRAVPYDDTRLLPRHTRRHCRLWRHFRPELCQPQALVSGDR